jgi:uncharacterized membrane protein (DUF485 family)
MAQFCTSCATCLQKETASILPFHRKKSRSLRLLPCSLFVYIPTRAASLLAYCKIILIILFVLLNILIGYFKYLAWCGNPDCTWPIIIHVTQFVGKPLNVVRTNIRVIVNYQVVGRTNSSLAHILWDEKEVVDVLVVYCVINNSPRRRVFQIVSLNVI